MVDLNAIWVQARSDLILAIERNGSDLFLWEHSARVAKAARAIAHLPAVQAKSPDEAVVLAAALYHDADWVTRVHAGEVDRSQILLHQPPDNHRVRSAEVMERSLAKLMPAESVTRASRVIRNLYARDTAQIEGQIVADAESLDEFGLLAFWPSIRRGSLDGKGVKAVLDTWHRRKEYRFWTARLKDSFHFSEVRELAKERLAAYERAMVAVEEQHTAADLERLVDGSVVTPMHEDSVVP